MRTPPVSLTFRTFSIVSLLLFSRPVAWGYRPFVSTDAAVADLKEMEIEIGYFNLERERGKNTFIVPKVVLNYGLIRDVEFVGEFAVEEPPRGAARLADPGLSLKAVLKDGVLQEKSGVSFAIEAGPLLPSTNREENRFGFEGIGIMSGKLGALTYHLNFGGGVDRLRSNPFMLWGVIAELPIVEKWGKSTERAFDETLQITPLSLELSGIRQYPISLSTPGLGEVSAMRPLTGCLQRA
jgi:hypothetical protein